MYANAQRQNATEDSVYSSSHHVNLGASAPPKSNLAEVEEALAAARQLSSDVVKIVGKIAGYVPLPDPQTPDVHPNGMMENLADIAKFAHGQMQVAMSELERLDRATNY